MTPQALQPLLVLSRQLHRHGFAVAPDQTIGFIEAVGVLGPRDVQDIRRAAIALFAIPPDRMFEFDAIFQAVFLGLTVAAQAEGSDDEVDAFEPTGGEQSVEVQDSQSEVGVGPAGGEQLRSREFTVRETDQVLIEFERKAKEQLPHRRSYRWKANSRGDKLDFRRSLRSAAKHDGEVIDLAYLQRKKRQRRILLLIDVSGSMKERSSSSLRFAHSLLRVANHAEVFTLGTRLTRITTALTPSDVNLALHRVSQLVADFDGGTRIGGALQAYLSIPKYAGFARGAAVVVLSDGLERGEPDEMVDATRKLSRLAWRLSWLTPLAEDSQYQPETRALKQILPYVDQLDDGHSVQAICDHLIQLARTA